MNEKFAHTPGRLWVECGDEDDGHANQWPKIRAESHEVVGDEGFYGDIDEDKANARRLVACWNACEGIGTEELESETHAALGWSRTASKLIKASGERAELLEMLNGVLKCERGILGHIFLEGWQEDAIRAAIAKATGKNSEAA